MSARFDRWLFEAWATPADQIAGFRIAVCAYLLFLGMWPPPLLAEVPPEALRPPLGPFLLLPGYPPAWLLLAVQASGFVAVWLLLLGRAPRTMALLATGCGVFLSGVTFSVGGKIDHNILLVLAPLAAGFAHAGAATTPRERDARAWPIAVFALVVGFSLFTSGFFKAQGGWLAVADSSVQGLQLRNLHVYGRDVLLAPYAAQVTTHWLWELADYGTVALECSFLVLPFFPRAMRVGLLLMAGLHLGIMLLMNISFAGNIVVYALFLRWPRWARALGRRGRAFCERFSLPLALTLGVAAAALTLHAGPLRAAVFRVLGEPETGALLCALGFAFATACALQSREPAP